MSVVGWSALLTRQNAGNLALASLGVWLHAADSLVVATLLPAIVAELGQVNLVAWTFALYELGTIVAGAAGALAATRLGLRRAMALAALAYLAGCIVSATASSMPPMLAGRLLQGLGGGGLMALSFVAVGRLFAPALMPRVMATISALWGVSAFAGPFAGGVFAEIGWWRGAFWFFGVQAGLLALWIALARGLATELPGNRQERTVASGHGGENGAATSAFPGLRLGILAGGVIMIAAAGIDVRPVRSALLIAAGVALIALFAALDRRSGDARLLPPAAFNPAAALGAPLMMALSFAMATSAIGLYGPLLMTVLHGVSALEAGYVVALASIGWSVAAVATSGAAERHDSMLIAGGMITLTLSVFGFMATMPDGPFWALPLFATLEGAGFGVAWTFILRRALARAPAGERDRFASALPTIHRLGYALGAAMIGIVANAAGFRDGVSVETAHPVAFWVFFAGLPFAAVGLYATWRFTRKRG